MTGINTGTKTITGTGKQSTDGLLSGFAWNGTITYAFPTTADDYGGAPYGSYNEPFSGFAAVSALQVAAARFALDIGDGKIANDGFSVEGFTGVKITAGSTTTATLRFAETSESGTAHAYFPTTATPGGDVWFGEGYRSPVAGNYEWATMLHEIGHALGLKHGHQEGFGFPALPEASDSMEYSIMTYRASVGGPTTGYRNEEFGFAQSYMMYDIAALQHMYGADFTTNSDATVYKWNPNSGDTLVNGQVAIDAGGNRIFATIWDGGGNDTYDLSAYTTGVTVDLRPGFFSKFSAVQLAKLDFVTSTFARGNIFNALLFKGDLRSLIENAKGGSGSDTIRGNQAANALYGNNGNDKLYGLDGNDKLYGGAGNDTLDGGNGNDLLLGGAGIDKLIGGAGTDTASYAGATAGVTASLANPSINTKDATGDTYSSIENLIGSSFADKLIGDGGVNVLTGGAGNDTLDGGLGNDTLNGGVGADKLVGGSGTDTATYAGATAGVTASLAKPSVNTNDAKGDTYSSIENLIGSSFNDKLIGNGSANTLSGAAGNDTLDGGAGADKLVGGDGTDTASYASATKGVTASLITPSSNTNDAKGDTYSSIENLGGSKYADKLVGNAGVNKIAGGLGNDTLTGGAGADDFVFAAGYGRDTITDFQNNVDDIDLRTYNFASVSSVLSKSFQVGADVEIRLTSTDVIILKNFTKANLDAADFLL